MTSKLLRLAALLPLSLSGRDVDLWRDRVMELALESAALAADPTAAEAVPILWGAAGSVVGSEGE